VELHVLASESDPGESERPASGVLDGERTKRGETVDFRTPEAILPVRGRFVEVLGPFKGDPSLLEVMTAGIERQKLDELRFRNTG
jgi:hypothetical protein